MAENNPTADSRLVPVRLPEVQAGILRCDLASWIDALRADLREPERLGDPERARRELGAYERLLAGLNERALSVPDEEARAVFQEAADAHDKENGYAEVVAVHDAMHALLAVLGGER